ncbi:MAG: two-component system chemotaxis response regulator CheY [Oleiphilaceae bacterium]|jgi:two-component system chemotaxis response regulator CheY
MKKILIVDDAMTVRMYHRQLMESMGFEVDEAENGIEALEKGMTKSYDLFLVDVNMPKMDGYRLVEEMRQNEELMAMPVIMVSTEEEDKDKDKAYMAGANFYIVKPAKPNDLKEYVLLLLGEED